jgi:hypothetical protein
VPGAFPGDSITQPLVVSQLPYSNTLDATAATTSPDDPTMSTCVDFATRRAVWFQFTPSAPESIQISTAGSTYDTVLGVFSGAPGSLVLTNCNDDANGSSQSAVNAVLAPGITYYIGVASYYDEPAGSLSLTIQRIPKPTRTPSPTPIPTQTPSPTSAPTQTPSPTTAPTQTPATGSAANDDFDQALVISQLPYSATLTGFTATTAQDDPLLQCIMGWQGEKSVWFRYTPNSTELVQVNTFGSNYDTVLAVYTGSRGSLTSIGCNDDARGLTSALDLTLVANTTYYIEVTDLGGFTSQLNLILNVRSCGAACKPADPDAALPLSLTAALADGAALASPDGVTFSVPPQPSLLSTSDSLTLTYSPVPWPAKPPGSLPLRAFRLDASLADAAASPLANPATVEVQLDLAALPPTQRPWLFEWSPQGAWLLLPDQHFDPLTGRITARTRRPGLFALAVADIRTTFLPSVSMP